MKFQYKELKDLPGIAEVSALVTTAIDHMKKGAIDAIPSELDSPAIRSLHEAMTKLKELTQSLPDERQNELLLKASVEIYAVVDSQYNLSTKKYGADSAEGQMLERTLLAAQTIVYTFGLKADKLPKDSLPETAKMFFFKGTEFSKPNINLMNASDLAHEALVYIFNGGAAKEEGGNTLPVHVRYKEVSRQMFAELETGLINIPENKKYPALLSAAQQMLRAIESIESYVAGQHTAPLTGDITRDEGQLARDTGQYTECRRLVLADVAHYKGKCESAGKPAGLRTGAKAKEADGKPQGIEEPRSSIKRE